METIDRNLEWDGCYNVRDLGGLPTVDGGQTRQGAIVRADVLGRLTEQGKRQLLDYGVSTIVDLRMPSEIAEQPSAVFAKGVQAPLMINPRLQQRLPFVQAMFKQAESRSELYSIGLDHYPLNNVRSIRAIANADPGAVVFHCHSGKDRTGIAAALMLSLAGVQKEAIAADYAATQARLWPVYQKWLEETGGTEEISRWYIPITEPETMLETLAHLERRWGGVEAYLLRAGQTRQEIEQVRERLVG